MLLFSSVWLKLSGKLNEQTKDGCFQFATAMRSTKGTTEWLDSEQAQFWLQITFSISSTTRLGKRAFSATFPCCRISFEVNTYLETGLWNLHYVKVPHRGKSGYNIMLITQWPAEEHNGQNLLTKFRYWNVKNTQLKTAHQMRSDILSWKLHTKRDLISI